MDKLIDIRAYPIKDVLTILLKDKTTKQNIIWATDAYSDHGPHFSDRSQITWDSFAGEDAVDLQPRILKSPEAQQERTRKRAEVPTPVWICNKMNNHADEVWFGRKDVFNKENEDGTWVVTEGKIEFPQNKRWQRYIDSRRLEITCGEAPYLVSRYDTSTGEMIVPPLRRIGMLDRKFRIVNENTWSKEEWTKWTTRALQSCYGYEWQGDSLLIGRINILMTFYEHYMERWSSEPDPKLLKLVANIIAWNLWQMDGLKDTVPLGKPKETEWHQMTMFELLNAEQEEKPAPYCKIYDWRRDNSKLYKELKEG